VALLLTFPIFMDENTIIILGSARKDGDTAAVVQELVELTDWPVIDLNDYHINYYDYSHENRTDDYLPLMRKLLAEYDTFIFATPVYWYAMSGIMKVFFDRFTDLLTIEKDLGRQLRAKKMAALSCSGGDNLGDDFWHPFRATAEYLGMKYLGDRHAMKKQSNEKKLQAFLAEIAES